MKTTNKKTTKRKPHKTVEPKTVRPFDGSEEIRLLHEQIVKGLADRSCAIEVACERLEKRSAAIHIVNISTRELNVRLCESVRQLQDESETIGKRLSGLRANNTELRKMLGKCFDSLSDDNHTLRKMMTKCFDSLRADNMALRNMFKAEFSDTPRCACSFPDFKQEVRSMADDLLAMRVMFMDEIANNRKRSIVLRLLRFWCWGRKPSVGNGS